MSYNYSTNWFEYSEVKQELYKYINSNEVNTFLEIGAFEGAFSCFISDNYLDSEKSTLTCVDPFNIEDTTTPVYSNIKNVFISNITKSKHFQKIRLRQLYSDDFFKINTSMFTFIYIDGSHLLENIEKDLINAIKIIKLNGIIWMDDYSSSTEVTNLIDKIYDDNKSVLEIIHKKYQIAFRRIY